MTDLRSERERLHASERRIAAALDDLRAKVAALGPSESEILAAEVAAVRRAAPRGSEQDWREQLADIRGALADAQHTARQMTHRRGAARRAAWAQAAVHLSGVADTLPAAERDPAAPGGRALRHGWLAGLTLGALLLGDGLATMVWQEPLSALSARQAQDHLSSQLPRLIDSYGQLARGRVPDFGADARRLAERVQTGGALGRIELPKLGTGFVVVQGTTTKALETGPGHYAGTALPGEDGTVGIAGHRTTYLAPFRGVDRLSAGDRVVLEMPYGRFVYRVTRRDRVNPTAASVLRPATTGQRLVLTTCDPVFSDARRLVVFARLVDARR